jgi:hypothetical protein
VVYSGIVQFIHDFSLFRGQFRQISLYIQVVDKPRSQNNNHFTVYTGIRQPRSQNNNQDNY